MVRRGPQGTLDQYRGREGTVRQPERASFPRTRIVFQRQRQQDYRLVVSVDFEKSIVWIKWIGHTTATMTGST